MSEYLNEPDSDDDSNNKDSSRKVFSEEEINEAKEKSLALKDEGNQFFSQGIEITDFFNI